MLTKCRHVTPFHTYEWTKANLCSFESECVRVLAFWQGDAGLVGILPLVLRRGRRYAKVRGWVEFAGLPHADYGGVLVCPGYELPVAESFLDFLNTWVTTGDGICLEKLRQEEEFVQPLLSAARRLGWHVAVRQSDRVRLLSKEDYFQSQRGSRSGKSLEKARRKLALQGELRFEVYDQADQIQDQLEVFVRLHIARFANLGLQSPLDSPAHRNFYRRIIQECATGGYLWFSRLTCGEIPVAMRISFLCNEKLHLYSACFAQEFSKYSPSVIQLGMLLEYAFHHGVTAVDFGIGESPHKEQAGTTLQSPLLHVELYRDTLPFMESRSYHIVERIGHRWPVVRRAGKMLRKVLPYGM